MKWLNSSLLSRYSVWINKNYSICITVLFCIKVNLSSSAPLSSLLINSHNKIILIHPQWDFSLSLVVKHIIHCSPYNLFHINSLSAIDIEWRISFIIELYNTIIFLNILVSAPFIQHFNLIQNVTHCQGERLQRWY